MSSNLKVNSLVPATGTEIGIGTTGGSIDFRCPATFGGNVTIGGTLTYDEVINIDSIGVITARSNIDCNGSLDVDGHTDLDNVSIAGVTTFTGQARFNGELVGSTISVLSGSSINIPDKLIHSGDTDTAIRFPANDTFTVETAGSEVLRITSDRKVGINRTSPARHLHAYAAGAGFVAKFEGSYSYSAVEFADTGTTNAPYIGSKNDHFTISTGGNNERVRITSGGFVGIGVTNPEDYDSGAKNLVVGSAGQEGITIRSSSPNTGNLQFSDGINKIAGITFKHDSTASNRYFSFLIDNGSSYVEQFRIQDGKLILSNDQNSYITGGSDVFRFTTGGTERVRINGSGNVKLPDSAQLQFGGALSSGNGDLQIFHDSSANFNNIQSQPGSNLRIRQLSNGAGLYLAATHIYLQNHNNNQTYLHAQNGGSVILNHSGNARAYTAADGFALSRVNTFPNPNNTGSEITGAMLDIGGNLHLEERYPAGAYSDRQDLVLRFNTGYGLGFSDKVRFTSGGKIELQVDGGGIRFPNTQTPTNAMTSRVGISSEMRYYESGEFVPGLTSTVLNGLQLPAFTNASYTRRIGRYVRVGNLVFLNIEILMAGSVTYANGSTSTAPVCITGIPFSFQYGNRWASTGHPDYYPCAISYSSTGLSNDTLYAVLTRNYNAQPRIEITKPGSGGSRQYNSTNFGEVFPANGHIIVSCTYCIDANNADY